MGKSNMYQLSVGDIRRFLKYIFPLKGCWVWNGAKSRGGYGHFQITKSGKRCDIVTHRLSYELFKGKIPKGCLVCHSCDNPPCVNPFHLFVGSYRDNLIDSIKKGRWHNGTLSNTRPQGELHKSAKLTKAQVLEIRKRYIPHKVTAKMLCQQYNVSRSLISRIVTRICWRHI